MHRILSSQMWIVDPDQGQVAEGCAWLMLAVNGLPESWWLIPYSASCIFQYWWFQPVLIYSYMLVLFNPHCAEDWLRPVDFWKGRSHQPNILLVGHRPYIDVQVRFPFLGWSANIQLFFGAGMVRNVLHSNKCSRLNTTCTVRMSRNWCKRRSWAISVC